MDFPHVDERTDEKFTRLWPLVDQNVKVKEAAKADPAMLGVPSKQEKADAGGFHYKLYEARIPAGVDVDKAFGAWATEEAKAASIAEGESARKAKDIVKQKGPAEELRYYPAVEAEEGKNRDAFNKTVAAIAEARGLERKDIVKYDNSAEVKAFVSKVGPLPELAYWQTPEARAAWQAEGAKLQKGVDKSAGRAEEIVNRAAALGKGEEFLGRYGEKGLQMPPKKFAKERGEVEAEIRSASTEDLQKVRAASEREFKALEKRLYAIQIEAAKKNNPDLTPEAFNKMKPEERREAAKYEELSSDDFRRMVRTKDGFFRLNDELNERGEHLTVNQARDLKAKGEAQEQAKPVDEKGKGQKVDTAEPEKAAEQGGRQRSRGAMSAAAAMASQLNR